LNINHFKMAEDMALTIMHWGPLNGITSVPNFMKIYQAVQQLLVQGHRHRQTDWWFDKHTFIFGKYAKDWSMHKNIKEIKTLEMNQSCSVFMKK
jgi:hypothetical protein